MAQGPTYRVKFRRRREGKTDYYRRQKLLRSKLPRLVIRKTNTKIICQVVNASVVGDATVASAISSELKNHGWVAGTANLPAAYLTGYLLGLKAKSRGVDNAVLDIGLTPPIKGSKIYAALKGAVDAGLDVPHNPEVFPDDTRITGEHIINAYEQFAGPESTMFSELGKKKVTITGIPKQFEKVKQTLAEIPKADLKKSKKKPAAAKKAVGKPVKKPKREKPAERPPRAIPRKPKPKKLVSRGKGKKGKK